MNKISKKIVALATMAAFVLTLVPAAAFGATLEPDNSSIYLSDKKTAYVEVGDQVDYKLDLKDASYEAADTTANLYIWAEDEEGNVTRYVQFYDNKDETGKLVTDSNILKVLDGGYALNASQNTDGREMAIAFTRGGIYTIHAGYALNNTDITTRTQLIPVDSVDGQDTIDVAAPAVEVAGITVEGITVEGSNLGDIENVLKDNAVATYTLGDDFLYNGIDTATVKGNVYDKDGNLVRNQELTVSSSNTRNVEINGEATATVPVDKNGAFEFEVSLDGQDAYKLYISNADIDVTLNIGVDKTADNENITTALNNGKVLLAETATVDFSDAVQFTITDENGNEVSGSAALNGEKAASYTADSKYMSIESKPNRSTLSSADLKLVWDNGVYTLDYNETNNNPERDLIAGEYTVKVGLNSGKTAEATFTLDNFGEAQDLILKIETKEYGSAAANYVESDNEVAIGDDFRVVPYHVDEKGIEQQVTGTDLNNIVMDVAYTPEQVYKTYEGWQFTINNDEELVGQTIAVKAYDSSIPKFVETEVTIVEELGAYTLAFDSESGDANTNNKVGVSVVDENGDVVKSIGGTVTGYVADKSNEDARIEIVDNDNDVTSGKGTLTLFSNEETTAEIVVIVNDNGKLYGATLDYTFGPEDVNADTSVVMTIGSTDYVVNNDIVAGDAAPYIDSAWRTMVPIRALAETFGATVDFKDNVITIVDGDTTIVMSVGETAYTVNDEEANMDTAPVIGEGDRTFVPVRFVAEALGYTVTPLQDANGLTASVVFQK